MIIIDADPDFQNEMNTIDRKLEKDTDYLYFVTSKINEIKNDFEEKNIKKIGKELSDSGGLRLMQYVFYVVTVELSSEKKFELDVWWDGVGDWSEYGEENRKING